MIAGNDKYTFKLSGSEETHERMTETAIKINEKLSSRGKSLDDVSPEELRDIVDECTH